MWDLLAILISLAALGISLGTFVRQGRKDRKEQEFNLDLEGRSLTFVTDYGQPIPIVGVRVKNENPRYQIRVNSVAFTPADQQEKPTLWFTGGELDLPKTIEPRDGETFDLPIERISEVDDLVGPLFVAWVELKTGEIFRSPPKSRDDEDVIPEHG